MSRGLEALYAVKLPFSVTNTLYNDTLYNDSLGRKFSENVTVRSECIVECTKVLEVIRVRSGHVPIHN